MVADHYRLLVFDWDGTLIDSIARIVASMEAAFEDLNLAPPPQSVIRHRIGLALREALCEMAPSAGATTVDRLVERYRYYFMEASRVPAPLFPGAHETLSALRKHGYLLALATGKARRGLDRALHESGCAGLFDASRCADEGHSKPHPQMLQAIMAELGVTPQATVMIGDSVYDLLMAQQAQTDAIAVTYGVHGRHELMAYQPRAFIDKLDDLTGLFAEM